MKHKEIFLVILVILFFQNCDIINPKTSNLSSIEGEILFQLKESYTYQEIEEPHISLYLETKKEYPCCNYSIETHTNIQNNNIYVKLNGIYKPGVCATAFGPARQEINLENIKGKYNLIFTSFRRVNQYQIVISDSSIKIKGDGTDYTKPEYNTLWRRPENSFAYLCGTTVEDSLIFTKFLDTMSSEINIKEIYFSETGKLSYPSYIDGHYINHPVKYFSYETELDFQKIKLILQKYKMNHFSDDNGVSISIINWKNEKFKSWLL